MKRIAERIADYAIRASFDHNFSAVEKILEAQGAEVTWSHDKTEVRVKTKTMACGLVMGMDPVTCWAQICLMLFGRLGLKLPFCLDALPIVNKRWAERSKELKERKKTETSKTETSAERARTTGLLKEAVNPQMDLFGGEA